MACTPSSAPSRPCLAAPTLRDHVVSRQAAPCPVSPADRAGRCRGVPCRNAAAMARLSKVMQRSSEKGDAGAAPGSLVRLSRVRTARSVADPYRCGVPRSCAADTTDRRRRPDRNRVGSNSLRDRPHLQRRRAIRGARDHLRARGASRTCTAAGTSQGNISRTWSSMGWPVKSSIPRKGSFTSGWRTGADVRHLSRLQRLARRFCRTDPKRLKGIAMINLDDVQDGIKELERAARLGLAGAMITEYPLEHRRYDQPDYEPFGPPPRRSTCRSACTRPRDGRARSAEPETRRCATPAAARPRRSIRRCRCAT